METNLDKHEKDSLEVGDIVVHHLHGKGQVVAVGKDFFYPVQAVFKNSPALRIKCPVTLCFSSLGVEIAMSGKGEKLQRWGHSSVAI